MAAEQECGESQSSDPALGLVDQQAKRRVRHRDPGSFDHQP